MLLMQKQIIFFKRTFCLVVYKIEEKDKQKQIIVENLGKPEKSYDGFTAQLPADECRYAENCRSMILISSPDTAKVMTKMICTSSKERFKRELDGIQVV
ncbi:hypothetical protein MKW94_026804 [Papaver nudicaule]|uniref:ADF-H domain-containing protein n=1 Tax=Papaver nudicaule TaxID=74823 RepID=A0AA41V8A3_PAPNU|nr:hypothetical protein [Papaver nudicaule]